MGGINPTDLVLAHCGWGTEHTTNTIIMDKFAHLIRRSFKLNPMHPLLTTILARPSATVFCTRKNMENPNFLYSFDVVLVSLYHVAKWSYRVQIVVYPIHNLLRVTLQPNIPGSFVPLPLKSFHDFPTLNFRTIVGLYYAAKAPNPITIAITHNSSAASQFVNSARVRE